MYILGCSYEHNSDREASNKIEDLQLLTCGDLYSEIDHEAIDTQMLFLPGNLLMCAANAELQFQISKISQPLSSCSLLLLAKESL